MVAQRRLSRKIESYLRRKKSHNNKNNWSCVGRGSSVNMKSCKSGKEKSVVMHSKIKTEEVNSKFELQDKWISIKS